MPSIRSLADSLPNHQQKLISVENNQQPDELSLDKINPSSKSGVELPSEDELQTLRRVPGSVNLAAYLIALVELVERFSYYGSTVVFTNFIQRPLPPGSVTGAGGLQSGALNMGQRASTGITTFNSFWVYVCPLFGAYVADAHLGRYNTIIISVIIALIGHLLLVVCALPSIIVKPNSSLACFLCAIIIMGIGTGGFKPNISPLVAEQSEREGTSKPSVRTLKSGERVVVDPALTAERIYLYFYLMINVGALVGQIGMVYAEKYVGYWLAFLLPTVLFLLCPLVLIFGKRLYVLRPPTGSVFARVLRLWRFAISKRWRARRHSSPSVGFWDAVKPTSLEKAGEKKPSWMKFDDQWVDEVRRGFEACRVFLWFPLYWITYNQMNNNLTSQAATMNTHGLPNDILSNLDPLALIILLPLCDMVFYPALRRAGINFSPIKKITAGFFTGSLAMISAAVTQHYIYKGSSCGRFANKDGCEPVSISVWVQTPSYLLLAISEILASVTGLEYAFTLAPKNMRSLVMSLFLFQSAIASAIGEAFNALSEDPLLVWNYGTMALIAFLAGIGFYFSHRALDAEHSELLKIGEGLFRSTSAIFEGPTSTLSPTREKESQETKKLGR
ncbi:hypothetical protein CROQUDRAFT_662105 [Cronartium quercuum f. sp. fusiforme G11]|uniref:Uncharacterized protein n=1 Tax=Cronartium quercuum f. sp. fusiforme G11 TaxID=708437 RepID=A0A9P6NA44_9BASI|nr:hypothetical protein CROQUDRAFT_662105 [Cronartium quercuum f. sp. fusiforme G11]